MSKEDLNTADVHSHCYFQEENRDRNVFSLFGYGAMHINIAVNVPELA